MMLLAIYKQMLLLLVIINSGCKNNLNKLRGWSRDEFQHVLNWNSVAIRTWRVSAPFSFVGWHHYCASPNSGFSLDWKFWLRIHEIFKPFNPGWNFHPVLAESGQTLSRGWNVALTETRCVTAENLVLRNPVWNLHPANQAEMSHPIELKLAK